MIAPESITQTETLRLIARLVLGGPVDREKPDMRAQYLSKRQYEQKQARADGDIATYLLF